VEKGGCLRVLDPSRFQPFLFAQKIDWPVTLKHLSQKEFQATTGQSDPIYARFLLGVQVFLIFGQNSGFVKALFAI